MCPSLIEIGSKTAEKNSAQTNKETDTTKIMVTWPWTNIILQGLWQAVNGADDFPADHGTSSRSSVCFAGAVRAI